DPHAVLRPGALRGPGHVDGRSHHELRPHGDPTHHCSTRGRHPGGLDHSPHAGRGHNRMTDTSSLDRTDLRADPHIVGSYDPSRRWLALATLAFSLLAITTDMTILNVAIPQMSADLQPTASEQLWIIDVYSLVMAGLLISMSSIADRWGRKRMLMLGYVLIALASVLMLPAPSPGL